MLYSDRDVVVPAKAEDLPCQIAEIRGVGPPLFGQVVDSRQIVRPDHHSLVLEKVEKVHQTEVHCLELQPVDALILRGFLIPGTLGHMYCIEGCPPPFERTVSTQFLSLLQ